jgi:uncharacterized OB-fold protein
MTQESSHELGGTVSETSEIPFRMLPRMNGRTHEFWAAGETGELKFLRCQVCGYYNHPPTPLCPKCHSKNLQWEAVSGDATVVTYSVNYQAWMPGPELPYVVGIVELPEQEGLRLTTNIVGCDPETVTVGLPVHVTFENHEDVWIPLFAPREA